MLRITIATGEARGNERTPDKSYSNTLASGKEGICFDMKPDKMEMQYFRGLYVLEETLDLKENKKDPTRRFQPSFL